MSIEVREKIKALHVFRETNICLMAGARANIFFEGLHVIKVYQESYYIRNIRKSFLGRAQKTARLFSHVYFKMWTKQRNVIKINTWRVVTS